MTASFNKMFFVLSAFVALQAQADLRPGPDTRRCTRETATMQHPDTLECRQASNGCKIADLEEIGFQIVNECKAAPLPERTRPPEGSKGIALTCGEFKDSRRTLPSSAGVQIVRNVRGQFFTREIVEGKAVDKILEKSARDEKISSNAKFSMHVDRMQDGAIILATLQLKKSKFKAICVR